jgi:hypothetical protein
MLDAVFAISGKVESEYAKCFKILLIIDLYKEPFANKNIAEYLSSKRGGF